MTKGEIAKQNFENGYNCAQSVVLAFCEDYGFDSETAAMLSLPFGGGMGRMREVCGTLSGAFMVLGLAKGSPDPGDRDNKSQIYREVQLFSEQFRKDNGSIICRDLLGLRIKGKSSPEPSQRTEEYYSARPCSQLCRYAADLLDNFLRKKR